MPRFLVFVLLIALIPRVPPVALGAETPWRDGSRVVFLGDSITQVGTFIRYIEGFALTRFPDRQIEFINLGLSSETASGTVEPDHPYPRPDVRERLGRALALAKPDYVVICYGMNDGVYAPPDPARLEAYRRGMTEVVEAARKVGAGVIVGTPPPFDPRPVPGKLVPLSAPKFGSRNNIYEGYNGVLGLYAQWLIANRDRGWAVADIHGATLGFLAHARLTDPKFTLAPDGIHPDANGHWLIAQTYLEAWDAPPVVDAAAIDAGSRQVLAGRVEAVTAAADGGLQFTWTTRIPLPRDPAWDFRLILGERIDERFNRHLLVVAALPRPLYSVYENDRKLGRATREQLESGLDLLTFPDLSTNRRATALFPLIGRRRATLDPAWLEAVGHRAPVFPQAISIDEARRRTAPLEAEIRALARPVPVTLRLVPEPG